MRTTERTSRRSPLTLAIGLLVLLGAAGGAVAQDLPSLPGGAEEQAAPDPATPEAIAARLESVRAEIAAADATRADAEPEIADHIHQVLDALHSIEALVERQNGLANPAAVPVEEAAAEPPMEPSPFALHALYESQLAAEQTPAELAESRDRLERAKERFDAAERSRRKANSEWENAEPHDRERAARKLERRRLDSRVAQEEVTLRRLETRAVQAAIDSQKAREAGDERIQRMRERLALGEGNSAPGFAALTEREGELRRAREASERKLATAELQLTRAQRRFSQHSDPPVALLEEVDARTARRDAIRQEIALADARIERLASQRDVWKHWGLLLAGRGTPEDLGTWEAAASERIDSLEQAKLRRHGTAEDLARRIAALEAQIESLPSDARVRPALVEQAETLRLLRAEQLAEVTALAADARLSRRLVDDIHIRTGHVDPLEYLARGAGLVRDVWTYEITAVDDAPISVGSVLLALALFGIGLWGSRRGSAIVGRLAEVRLGVDAGAAHALQTLSFYALLLGFTLMALRAVHFPLTAFTVLGGALAIGIGFGSQNVMNNFISGLILMLERPVRARDTVEVDGNHGTIERIGARSTQIRSTDGRHMVVPNSFFLESNVINWTLSDDLIRAKVTVGVIYGSPTRVVEQLIRQVVDEDARVLSQPKPIIIFEEFGDNSLNFDVYFWVRARSPMEVRQVQSQVRFRIDDLFRTNQLVIAFPQRDVHLDSASPIEVRVLESNVRSQPDTDPS